MIIWQHTEQQKQRRARAGISEFVHLKESWNKAVIRDGEGNSDVSLFQDMILLSVENNQPTTIVVDTSHFQPLFVLRRTCRGFLPPWCAKNCRSEAVQLETFIFQCVSPKASLHKYMSLNCLITGTPFSPSHLFSKLTFLISSTVACSSLARALYIEEGENCENSPVVRYGIWKW